MTLALSDMDVSGVANDIKTMKTRGAGRIARAASVALSEFAKSYDGKEKEVFLREIAEQKKILLASRPTAVSLYNGVLLTLKGIDSCESVEDIRSKIVANSDSFVKSSNDGVKRIAKYGSELIKDGDIVLTHCNSTAAISVIIEAHKAGKKFRAFATESRPWGQGFITVTELSKAGVDITLVIDSAVTTIMDHVTKIFVGADTVTPIGNLYNKIGTSQIALIAKVKNKPFYVCAETYKFSPLFRKETVIEERARSEVLGNRPIPDSVKVFNPVFDCTVAENITNIITENGIISTKEVAKISKEKFGEKE